MFNTELIIQKNLSPNAVYLLVVAKPLLECGVLFNRQSFTNLVICCRTALKEQEIICAVEELFEKEFLCVEK